MQKKSNDTCKTVRLQNHKIMHTMNAEKRDALFDASELQGIKSAQQRQNSQGLLFHYFGSKKDVSISFALRAGHMQIR